MFQNATENNKSSLASEHLTWPSYFYLSRIAPGLVAIYQLLRDSASRKRNESVAGTKIAYNLSQSADSFNSKIKGTELIDLGIKFYENSEE